MIFPSYFTEIFAGHKTRMAENLSPFGSCRLRVIARCWVSLCVRVSVCVIAHCHVLSWLSCIVVDSCWVRMMCCVVVTSS